MKTDFGNFSEGVTELAHEMWEFRTCQRRDGSYYGTAGQCRKGTETDVKEEKSKAKAKSKAPLDTSVMSAMSDKQLSDLSKQKELDPTQKTAITNELRARGQAASEYDKFGNQARTEKAQKAIDEFYIKKDGGYVPRAEKTMKISEDDSYMGGDYLKQNIEFQKNVTGAPNDKTALANLQHGDRLQAMGAKENKFDILWETSTVSLNKMVDGNHVQLYNRAGTIGWQVNKSYSTQDLPTSTRRQIAQETRKMWETMVRASSNNYPMSTSAYTADGRGAERAKAYGKMGFSKTKQPGRTQYAKVVFGNVIPITKKEYDDLFDPLSAGIKDGSGLAMFSEPKGVKLPSKVLDKLWQIIIGL